MRKILFLLTLVAFTLGVNAQYTTPRTGTGVKYDLRKMNYKYIDKTDAEGADSASLSLNAHQTIYRLVLVDSFTLKQPVITNCYAGDELVIIASAASGTPFLKFTGSYWLTAGTATLSTNKRSVIRLLFDGAKWTEAGRYTQ